MADLGLDPETALKLIQILLRATAYFFAGFALLGLSIYVVFLFLEIFPPQPHAKAKIAKIIPQQAGRAPVVERPCDSIPAETRIPAEAASFLGEELMQKRAEPGRSTAQIAVSP